MGRLTTTQVCACLFLLECLCAPVLFAEDSSAPAILWRDMAASSLAEQPFPPRKPWVIRERPIAFDTRLLAILKDAGARPHPPVTVELFDSLRYQLEITSTVSRINDSAVIRGLLRGQTRGELTLVVNGTTVGGTIKIGDRPFKVEHVSNGRHRLLELDPDKMPPD